MTFFRRHWPDLIISLLIVALLVGFGLVLLGGNRKLGAQNGAQSPTPPASSQGATPAPPVTPNTVTPDTTQAAPTPPPASPPPAPAPTPSADIPQAPSDLQTIPAQPEPNAVTPAPAPSPTAADSTAGTSPASGASTQATSSPSTSVAGNPVATTSNDVPTRRNYRVSVGTYDSEAVAQERTAVISRLGYTVHLIPVAQGVVAQIGPFADEASGRRALSDIQRVFSGAVLRAPVGQPAPTTGTSASAPTPPASDQGSASQDSANSGGATQGSADQTGTADSADTPPAEPAPPPNTPVYLQVGAFDQQDRAQTLVQQLRDLGYVPSIIAPPGRKVRVLVGPYTGDALSRTEARLSQNGIDHFRVR